MQMKQNFYLFHVNIWISVILLIFAAKRYALCFMRSTKHDVTMLILRNNSVYFYRISLKFNTICANIYVSPVCTFYLWRSVSVSKFLFIYDSFFSSAYKYSSATVKLYYSDNLTVKSSKYNFTVH